MLVIITGMHSFLNRLTTVVNHLIIFSDDKIDNLMYPGEFCA